MARPAFPPAMKDALLCAVVSKLPPPGGPWPIEAREAWFTMMRNAVDVAYGPCESPPSVWPRPEAIVNAALNKVVVVPDTPVASPTVPAARYAIDPEGYALRDNAPVDPQEIPTGTVLHDYRPARTTDFDPDTGQEYDSLPIMWKSHGSKKMALPPGVAIAAATEPWKGKAYNGTTKT